MKRLILKKDRTGLHTTGIVAELTQSDFGKQKIALFASGRKHAGENLALLLEKRRQGLPLPMQISDAASSNFSENFKSIVIKCMDHGRRKFTDIELSFAKECGFIVEKLSHVYHFDQIAKDQRMTDWQRLIFHQTHSAPIMNDLNEWMETKLEDKQVEENSDIGGAINYFLKHWNGLTQFLRIPGAPLSNAEVERLLKRCVLRRKASLFYRTLHGSLIGDILMSVIETARFAGINIFEYLTDLQLFSKHVKANPEAWFPWNYVATRQLMA